MLTAHGSKDHCRPGARLALASTSERRIPARTADERILPKTTGLTTSLQRKVCCLRTPDLRRISGTNADAVPVVAEADEATTRELPGEVHPAFAQQVTAVSQKRLYTEYEFRTPHSLYRITFLLRLLPMS
jgi:hypothetical protein